jgi:hypothetical protein
MNVRGEMLMPCSPRKARILLKEKKATIVRHDPFTIQLLYATGETTQETNLGIDLGAKHITMMPLQLQGSPISKKIRLTFCISNNLGRKNALYMKQPLEKAEKKKIHNPNGMKRTQNQSVHGI